MDNSRSSLSCARWFAELVPEPAKLTDSGFARAADQVGERPVRAVRGDHDCVRRVVEAVDRCDVFGPELRAGLERLQHDVRQVDPR